VLDGVVVVVTGTDENGVQIGEFGSSEGSMQHQIMWGRPGAPDAGDILVKTNVTIKANTQMERPGPLAVHKATDAIVQAIRHALKQADEAVVATEELVHQRRLGAPRVVIIKEIMGQGAMHDNLLLPAEPVGVLGAKANVDLGNVPIVVSPLQVLDGAIHALTCVGPASKETSRHYWREPLVLEVMRDAELDLCAVILVGSPQSNAEKNYVSRILGMTVEAMDVHGAIVTTEGFGNNHIDFAGHIEQIGKRGIPVVGMAYAAVQGQLVIGNRYMDAMVELNKSESGIEDCVLANNTLTHEDAIRAIAMLKAKIVGERIQSAESQWTPEVKLRNMRAIEQYTGQTIGRSARERVFPDEVERR
jgi:D-proline reductase (dithiol) PrdA